MESSRGKYGANTYTQVPPKSFFAILYEGFKDPVILLLCAAATVSNTAAPERELRAAAADGCKRSLVPCMCFRQV